MQDIDRRQIIKAGAGICIAGGLLGNSCAPSIAWPPLRVARTPTRKAFPVFEASGTPYGVGHAIGTRFSKEIRMGLEGRAAWFSNLKRFVAADPARRFDPFVAAATKEYPHIIQELRGWADGAGLPFRDLMTLNMKAELGALMGEEGQDHAGCSTLALVYGDQMLLAHNEDGDRAYQDTMFVLKLNIDNQPAFTCLGYPGILPGNGPALNEHGLLQTTNFISSPKARIGVPRYIMSRATLTARDLDNALQIANNPQRAFGFHFNLGSFSEQRMLSLEMSLDDREIYDVAGLYVHTNHLVLPRMKEVPQDWAYVNNSSRSRSTILSRLANRARAYMDKLGPATLLAMLSSHEAVTPPYSPCRHPTAGVRGATVATAIFDLRAETFDLYAGNPCSALASRLS